MSGRTPPSMADLTPVASDPVAPASVDVVVVGGGIVGAATALALAEKGVSVALCEKGVIGGEQSGRNWGWCRKTGRDTRELALIAESLRMWERMDARLGANTGYRSCGALFVSDDPDRIARWEAWLDQARTHQFDSRIVTGAELERLLPGAARNYKAGLYTPSDGVAEPTLAAPAIAERARELGAAVLTGCAVRGIETEAGAVATVVTECGRIACRRVVLAGGAWSRLFCRHLGVRLPQLKVRATAQRTEPLDTDLDTAVWSADFAVRRRRDGGHTVATSGVNLIDLTPDSLRFFRQFLPAARMESAGLRLRLNRRFLKEWRWAGYRDVRQRSPYEEARVLDPDPSESIARRTKAALDAAFPQFAQAGSRQRWAGMIDVTPDAVPVISPADAVPGLVIATGFSGHGFGIGPAAGRLAADLATEQAPIVDPAPFRLDRFDAGAKPHLESWL